MSSPGEPVGTSLKSLFKGGHCIWQTSNTASSKKSYMTFASLYCTRTISDIMEAFHSSSFLLGTGFVVMKPTHWARILRSPLSVEELLEMKAPPEILCFACSRTVSVDGISKWTESWHLLQNCPFPPSHNININRIICREDYCVTQQCSPYHLHQSQWWACNLCLHSGLNLSLCLQPPSVCLQPPPLSTSFFPSYKLLKD